MMVRIAIIGVVVGVALVLYALVDAAMSDPARARGISKPAWVLVIVLLPVIGALLWLTIGKGRGPLPVPVKAPEDDPRFATPRLSSAEIDAHVEELEARLRELDNEVFPEVDDQEQRSGTASSGAAADAAEGTRPGTRGRNQVSGGDADPAAHDDPGAASSEGDAPGGQR